MELGEIVTDFVPPPHPAGLVLAGRFVRLEPLRAAHAAALHAANAVDGDGVNWAYLPYGPYQQAADYRAWVESVEGGDDPVFLAIINRQTGAPEGIASFLRINRADGVIEVGHINYAPALQRTTAATEAMFLMMRWVFENGYRRYEWKCNALNLKSRWAAQRLGFSFEGVFRQAAVVKGRNRDTAWFAMIDRDWPAIRACFERFLDQFDDQAAPSDRMQQPPVALSDLTRPLLYRRDDGAMIG